MCTFPECVVLLSVHCDKSQNPLEGKTFRVVALGLDIQNLLLNIILKEGFMVSYPAVLDTFTFCPRLRQGHVAPPLSYLVLCFFSTGLQ